MLIRFARCAASIGEALKPSLYRPHLSRPRGQISFLPFRGLFPGLPAAACRHRTERPAAVTGADRLSKVLDRNPSSRYAA